MSENDMSQLIDALDNDSNSSIMNLNSIKIKDQKNNILQKIQLPREKLKEYHKKLKKYRYCPEVGDVQYGFYIRWISLKSVGNLKITNGAFICEIKSINNEIHIVCKNGMNRMMQLKFDEVLIFQKLSEQEQLILGVLDYLED
jgi:hypothetical protein|tara:strand:+ start:14913 stop:15341 length:429 start_codon:yes stop_codon:yes gene_type:complete